MSISNLSLINVLDDIALSINCLKGHDTVKLFEYFDMAFQKVDKKIQLS